MHQKSFVKFGYVVLVALLGLLAACSRQAPSGELGSSVTCPVTPTPKTYYVKTTGNNTSNGTSLATAWKTIQYAVRQVCPGDTVNVQPGTYNEAVEITRSGSQGNPINLIGQGTYGTIIIQYTGATKNNYNQAAVRFAPGSTSNIDVIDITNPTTYIRDWYIRGFRINGGSDPANGNRPYIWAGILINRGERITIHQNYIVKTGASGIIVRAGNLPTCSSNGSYDLLLTNCARQNFNVDIYNNDIIEPNLGKANGDPDQEALTLDGVDGFNVFNNRVRDGLKEGITLKGPTRNGKLYNNTVTGQARSFNGSSLDGPAIYVGGQSADSFNIDIYNNTVYNNNAGGIAVSVENPAYTDAQGNFKACKVTLNCSGPIGSFPGTPFETRDIRIYNNLVYSNGYGVKGNGTPHNGKGIIINSQVKNIFVYHNTIAGNFGDFLINENYSGYYAYNLFFRNNIFSNPTNKGAIRNVGTVLFENNLFTGKTTDPNKTTIIYDLFVGTSSVTPANKFCLKNTKDVCPNPSPNPNNVDNSPLNKVTDDVKYAAGTSNYQLATDSPAVNSGRFLTVDPVTLPTVLANALTKDFTGGTATRPRPTGSRPDQGAYESTQ